MCAIWLMVDERSLLTIFPLMHIISYW